MEDMQSPKEKLAIVESRNAIKGKGEKQKIVLTVKAKDLPEGIKKEDLVAAFKLNAEEEEKKQEGEKAKFKAKYLVPILLPLVLIGAIKGCAGKQEKTYIDIQPISAIHYNIDSPYVYMEGVVNAEGQEGMTANVLDGNHAMYGQYYDCSEQFDAEERASKGQVEFEQLEEQLKENMKILTSEESTQEEKSEAAKNALDINQRIEQIYTENLGFINSQAAGFEKSTLAYEDQNSQAELAVIRETIDEYKENLGLTAENVGVLEQIVSLSNDGYTLEIKGDENARGDYTISGQAMKEIAEEVGLEKDAEKAFEHFVSDKEQNRDIEKTEEDNYAR